MFKPGYFGFKFCFLVAAVVCFVVALLYSLNEFSDSGNQWKNWIAGGSISFALGHLPWRE